MTKYNTLNIKLSNSQLDKLKSAMKNGTEVIFHRMLLVVLMIKIIFHISYY